jgi:predicted DNA-binding transcriptional regulator YafY
MNKSDPMKPRKTLPKTALPRIYFIDQEIASGRYPNAPSLAKKYETSLSSINRDIAYMRDMLNAPIEYDFFKKGFYYSEPMFRLSAGYASADDLLALGMAKELLDLYNGTPIQDAALNLLESISMPLKGAKNANWFKNRIVIPKSAFAPVNEGVWNSLVTALRENKIIRFQYRSRNRKEAENRRVRPYQLLFDRSSWYLFGYDENRKNMRVFALARITGIELTRDVFVIPENFDYRSLEGYSYYGVFTGPKSFKVLIEVYEDPQWIQERIWAPDQIIKEIKNGITLSFTSNQLQKILEWILGQGKRARPLAPKELVEQWKQSIREMGEMIS